MPVAAKAHANEADVMQAVGGQHPARVRLSGNLVLFAILAWFFLNFLVVSVQGEFPVNDDWIYCWCVKHIVETGEFHLPATIAASIFPIYSGAAVCKLFGFSYAALRCVSLAFALFGACGLYLTLKELGLHKREAAMGACLFLANPLLINVSFGFMTDVPALAMVNWFVLFTLRGLSRDRLSDWLLSGVVLCLAVASRQNAIILVVAGMIAIAAQLINKRKVIVPLVSLVVVPCALYVSLEPFMLKVADYPSAYLGYKALFTEQIKQFAVSPTTAFPALVQQISRMMCYLGLFCLPMTLALVAAATRLGRSSWKWLVPGLTVGGLLVGLPLCQLIANHTYMPLSENLFRPPAVGAYCILSGGLPMWSDGNRLCLTVVSGVAGAFLVGLVLSITIFLVVTRGHKLGRRWKGGAAREKQVVQMATLLVVAATAFSMAAFLAVQTMIMNLDRYYLAALAPAIMLMACIWRFVRADKFSLLALICLPVFCVYSTISAWDYMNFNRVRLEATRWLEGQGIRPLEIDGGPEYNYLQNLALAGGYELSKDRKGWTPDWRGAAPRNEWRWWPVSSENYIICGTPLDGYRTMRTFECFSSLKMRNRQIFVLESLSKKPLIESQPH